MNLKENIAKIEAELVEMKKQLEDNEKYELTANGWHISSRGTIQNFSAAHTVLSKGCIRGTKELAEIASRNMVTRNILEAWVHQIQGDGDGFYTIYKNGKGTYIIYEDTYPLLGAVYMKEETAKWICERLNDRRIKLKG